MENPPFLLVSCVEMLNDTTARSTGRSIAFPVAYTKAGKTLFCTCSHTITHHLEMGNKLLFHYADGTEVPLVDRILNNVMPLALNLDLSFFEIDSDEKIEVARLRDRVITTGLELSHVRNVCFREDFPDQKTVFATQVVGASTGKHMFLDEMFYKVDAGLRQKAKSVALPKSPHRGVAMRSWPGVSGSPLWDKSGNVLGMVAGGTEKLTEEYPRWNLVYLPAKQIQYCMRTFLQNKIK